MRSQRSAAAALSSALEDLRSIETLAGELGRARERWLRTNGTLNALAFEIGHLVLDGEPLRAIVETAACLDLRCVLQQSYLAERMLSWPRGYPGDYETIDLFYQGRAGGHTVLGQLIDRWIRQQEGPRALLRRPSDLSHLISTVAGRAGGRQLRVLVVASGPIAEVFEFLARSSPRRVTFTCLDTDENAHAFVRGRASQRQVGERIVTLACNALRVASGKEVLDLPPQDLAYSVGLNDYLEDAHSVSLLNWMRRTLAPGGTAVLGNLTKGAEAEFASSVLNWPLRYREAEDMERLFKASEFRGSSHRWTDDASGCQMYFAGLR
jgi:extracellular factor (EF) 3-hydroxypalmitic acid methyl ester biosynthesis protein